MLPRSRFWSFPVLAISASASCTCTGTPDCFSSRPANPMWSVCACVRMTASRSPIVRPSPATACSSCPRSRGRPASTRVSRPSSSIRKKLTSQLPRRCTPGATSEPMGGRYGFEPGFTRRAPRAIGREGRSSANLAISMSVLYATIVVSGPLPERKADARVQAGTMNDARPPS